jgi:subtilase family serine protease
LLCLCLLIGAVVGREKGYWTEVQRASKHETLSLRLALKQQNLDVLESTLLDTADPASANYGQWWSSEAILDLVSPSIRVSNSIVEFLVANGASNVANHRDMIKFQMKVSDIESLFATALYYFEHSNGRSVVVRASGTYTLPTDIAEYVDFVAGLKEFPVPRETKVTPVNSVDKGYVAVPHLQSLYSLPTTYTNNYNSSVGLIEFENDSSFSYDDIELFVQNMGIANFTVTTVVGPYNDSTPDLESSLDVQYGGAIGVNSTVWFWTVADWMYEFATDLLNTTNPPLVVSMSWGWPESDQCYVDPNGCSNGTSFQYVDRVNIEFQKIGLNGITLVAASGDQGAPGDLDYMCDNATNPFSTIFPGASPWVLSVGATMLDSSLTVEDEADAPICSQVKCATSTKEVACSFPDALITSGGGFSNVSPRPSFQDAAVTAYFKSGTKLPDSNFFNNSNRGFPDVSALGHNYLIAYSGSMGAVDGTSCSSPVLAGIISLLNSERLNNGKKSLGYVVPLVYAAYASNPATFKDITKGNNKCTENCCLKTGYETAKGWDPVTGLGTPQFPALLAYVQTLP